MNFIIAVILKEAKRAGDAYLLSTLAGNQNQSLKPFTKTILEFCSGYFPVTINIQGRKEIFQ